MIYTMNSDNWTENRDEDGNPRSMETHWVIPQPGERHRLRFVAQPYVMWCVHMKSMEPYGPMPYLRVHADMLEDVEPESELAGFRDPELSQFHAQMFIVSRVLNRAETVKYGDSFVSPLRLIHGPFHWFKPLRHYHQLTKVDPAGRKAPDFHLNFTSTNGQFLCDIHPDSDVVELVGDQLEYLRELHTNKTMYDLKAICDPIITPKDARAMMLAERGPSVCVDCGGSGKYVGFRSIKDCPTCKGKGKC